MSETTSPAPTALNLNRLILLRWIALGGQVAAVVAASQLFGIALPFVSLAFIFAMVALVNAATLLRLRRSWPVMEPELFAQFIFDTLALTVLLYFTGGSTNPFATLYLLPLTLTAAALPGLYTWAMAAVTIVCYSVLLFVYVPLPGEHAGHQDFRLHVFGMWLGFLLSAGLISYFAVRMTQTLRERERLRIEMEAKLREQQLRHERMLALGTFAAGAAHELGTPLATIAILTGEIARDPANATEKLGMLRTQLSRCKDILGSLAGAAGQTRAEGGSAQSLDAYLAALVERWREMRPHVQVATHYDGAQPAPRIVTEQTLTQALINILNNAADVSGVVEIGALWTESALVFDVRDRGPGVTPDVQEHAGEPFFSTKAPGEGMGLGLFLARGTIERLGGRVALINRDGGGAVCRVELPLTQIRVSTA